MSQRSEQVLLFAALYAAGVDYAVVGGVAVNAHGFVRNTRDLDIFIDPPLKTPKPPFVPSRSWGRRSKASTRPIC